ncbi:hypothetical protein AAVH_01513 [Aphelenchoides avenae]|nr:hypothetical protein AAVH_01513 [Aphelenchus avenae]
MNTFLVSTLATFSVAIILCTSTAQNVDEVDKTEVEQRRAHPLNPYSWMSAKQKKASLEEKLAEKEMEADYEEDLARLVKRARNPYSWMASERTPGASYQYGPRPKEKKSRGPYAWVTEYKRTRNPYSWLNFV